MMDALPIGDGVHVKMGRQRLQVFENVVAAITGARHGVVRDVASRLHVHAGLMTLYWQVMG